MPVKRAILPPGMQQLCALGLGEALEARAVVTREVYFCNRFGQLVHLEPRGRHAGYDWPQLSLHRGDLHQVLIDAVRERLGPDCLQLGAECVGVEQDAHGVTVHLSGGRHERACAVIGYDGFHSVVRRALYPNEGPPSYQGIDMWRGLSRWEPFLSGATMVTAGWLEVGKMVIYPIRQALDADGKQLINWVAEIQSEQHVLGRGQQGWERRGTLGDFLPRFGSWQFDWLDVPAMIRAAELILEYPMIDRDPLQRWTHGRVTLAGDAAHPMYPRGSNGAAQAVLDARGIAHCLANESDAVRGLRAYESLRLKPANDVVLASRAASPDTILREVHRRTADRPFRDISDVISAAEISEISENYRRISGAGVRNKG